MLNPGAIQNSSQFVNSFSAGPSDNFAVQTVGPTVHYLLEPGVSGGDYSLYSDLNCNKRISHAGAGEVGGATGPYAH